MNNTRDKIVDWMKNHPGPYSMDEIAEQSGIPESTLRNHMRKLASEGVLTGRRKGHKVFYSYNEGAQETGDLPTSITFKVMAELSGGRMLLGYHGNFFMAQMVNLEDIIR